MAGRNRAWADTRFGGVSLVAGTPLVSNLLTDAPTVDSLTVIRLVGHLDIQYTPTTTVADSLSTVDIGIGVASVEAVAGGQTVLPSPTVSTQYPPRGWLYVATLPCSQLITTDGGIIDHHAEFKFDLRAMRKIDKGVLFSVISNANVLIGGVMNITGRIRALCLT